MNDCYIQDFLDKLDALPKLPKNQSGEWTYHVRSSWIAGIINNGAQDDPDAVVQLHRFANNNPDFDSPVLDYAVFLELSDGQLEMNAPSAIALGHHLIAAGTTSMRDLARHAWFLAGQLDGSAVTR